MASDWFSSLGHPVSEEGRRAATSLLVEWYGAHAGNARLVIDVVAREIEHDNPERALACLRSFVAEIPALKSPGRKWNENVVIQTCAYLCCPPVEVGR
jgi:hypothetical protein